MSDRAPYSRVYHSIVDDAKFRDIYDDDRRLATWLRLLIVAEQAHPASAYIPAGTHRASILALVNAGLIDLGTGSRYRIHGLDAERTRRADAARVGGLASGRSRSVERPLNSGSRSAGTKSNLDETRRDEQRLDEGRRADARGEPHIEAWLMVKHRLPTPRQQAFLDRYLQVFDETGPQRMAQLILEHSDDPIAALKEDLDAFREQRLGELANGYPKPKPRPKREPWQDMFKAVLEAKEAELITTKPLPADKP